MRLGHRNYAVPCVPLSSNPCQFCSGKLHAWFPALWRPPLIASITKDAPAYTDVVWQMRRDAFITLALASGAVGALAVAGRAAAARL